MEGNGKHFNEQVESTAFAGEMRSEIRGLTAAVEKNTEALEDLSKFIKPVAAIVAAVPTLISLAALLRSFRVL